MYRVQHQSTTLKIKEALCLCFQALKADLICVKLSPLVQVENVRHQCPAAISMLGGIIHYYALLFFIERLGG